jgi:hypothetical protein
VIDTSVGPTRDGRHFDSETRLRDYFGFGTGFELGALVFFFAALAFCFCAACLCVAFGDLSPMNRKVRFLTIGVNTDRHRADENLRSAQRHFSPRGPRAGIQDYAMLMVCVTRLTVDDSKR